MTSKYDVIYVDIDDARYDEGFIQSLHETHGGIIKLYMTRNGYHLKIYPKKPIIGSTVFYIMSRLNADALALYNWLERGVQTLYNTRRGMKNEWLIKTWGA